MVKDYCSYERLEEPTVCSAFEKGFEVVEFSALYSFIFDAAALCHS